VLATTASFPSTGFAGPGRHKDRECLVEHLAPRHSKDVAAGRSRYRSPGFQDASHLVDPHQACPWLLTLPARVSRPRGDLQLAPHHRPSEPPSPRAPADRRAAPVGWLLVHRIEAVVVEAKGLTEGEPTAVRYNSSGLSGREPHSSPSSDRTLLRTRTYGKEMAAWLAAWLPLARIPGHSKHEGRHR
jgi:hypothetical protein